MYEKLCYVVSVVQDALAKVDSFQDQIDLKEDSSFITLNRLLSEVGDFSGTWKGEEIENILSSIAENYTNFQAIIERLEEGQSLDLIYDGGLYLDTDPPTTTIDGGNY